MTCSSSHLLGALSNLVFLSTSTISTRNSQSTTTSPASKASFQKEPPYIALNVSYCDMSFNALPGGKPIDEVRRILQQFITTINKIDETAFVVQCNQTFNLEEGMHSINSKLLISNEFSLLKFSFKLLLFFPQYKLRHNKTTPKHSLFTRIR